MHKSQIETKYHTKFIYHAIVATKFFVSTKDFFKAMENVDKSNIKDRDFKDVKSTINKDPNLNGNKKRDKGV